MRKSWLIKESVEKPDIIKTNRTGPFVWQWYWRAEWWLQELKTPKCELGKKFPLWIKTANQKNQQKINSLNQIQIRVSSWGTISCPSLDHFSAVLFSQRGLESVSPLLGFQIFCEFYSERGKTSHIILVTRLSLSQDFLLTSQLTAISKHFWIWKKKTHKSLGLFIYTKLFSVCFTSYRRPVQAFSLSRALSPPRL